MLGTIRLSLSTVILLGLSKWWKWNPPILTTKVNPCTKPIEFGYWLLKILFYRLHQVLQRGTKLAPFWPFWRIPPLVVHSKQVLIQGAVQSQKRITFFYGKVLFRTSDEVSLSYHRVELLEYDSRFDIVLS